MSDETLLTKEIVDQFIADEDSVDLTEFTAIEDDAAELLGKLSVHPFFCKLDDAEMPWIDIENIETLSPTALSYLRPDLKQLSQIFCERMQEPLNELKDSGKHYLENSAQTAISGFGALLGCWYDSSDPDEILWTNKEQPTRGNDIFGESLASHKLYFKIPTDHIDEDERSELTDCIEMLLGVSCWPSDEVTIGDETIGSRGYYIPVDRLCDSLRDKDWPHTIVGGNDELTLSLKELTASQARVISNIPGVVNFPKVPQLTQECADILASGSAKICFSGLKTIPKSDSHKVILRRMAEIGDELSFWQLEEADEDTSHLLFELSKKKSDGLYLGPCRLTENSLQILTRIQGIFSWDTPELSDSQADILCRHNADLSLRELRTLSDHAATRLSQFPYGLSLDLDEIPPSAAEILRSHPSFAESEEDDDDDYDED